MRLALLISLLLAPLVAHAEPVTTAVAVFAAWVGVETVTVYLVAATIVLSTGVAVYGSAQARRAERAARDAARAAMQDRMVNRIATEAPHRYIYGRCKVGADIVAMFTSGDRDQYKHLVCVHAAHECDAIEEIYVNNVAVGLRDANGDATTGRYATDPFSDVAEEVHTGPTFTLNRYPRSGTVRAFVGDGSDMAEVDVTSETGRSITVDHAGTVTVSYVYSVQRKFDGGEDWTEPVVSNPVVRVQVHLGTPTDPADAYLMSVVPDKWPATAVLRGLCYTVVTLDLNHPEFQNGQVPIHALIRGRKLYDPRTGTTAWSANPALVVYDYLTSPLCGVPASDLPVAQFIAAANVCDETVLSGGRYTINGTVTSDQSQSTVLESMAQAMAGSIVSTTWDIYAGKYVAPVMALSQSDIVGSISITPGASDAAIYNGVKGQYISAENNNVLTDYAPYQNSTYRAADGRDLYTNIDFPFTDSLQRVHNLARIFTEDQRNGFTLKAEFSLKAWPLKVGQRITFTSGFLGQSAKVYRITDKSYAPNSAVELILKEDAASIWDFADATTVDSTPNTDLPDPWAIAPLASLSCTSGEATLLRQADGTLVPRILVSWPAATSQAVFTNGQIEVEWRAVSSTTWNRVNVSGSDTQAYLSPITPGFFYTVRARCVNPYLNTRSDWIVTTYQVQVFHANPVVYQWAATQPSVPSGVSSYTWSSGAYATPTGWSVTPPAAPIGGGVSLWSAKVLVTDIDAAGTTSFSWADAAVASLSYSETPSTTGGLLTLPLTNPAWDGTVPVVTISDGKVGNQVRRSPAGSSVVMQHAGFFQINPSRTYRTRFWARASAGTNGLLYHDLKQALADGSDGPVNGGRSPYYPSAQAAHTDWREYTHDWDASHWQAGVTQVKPDFLLNYSGTAGYWEVQDYALIDVTEAMAAQTAAAAAQTTANNAQSAANAAQASANTANTAIASISSDSVLSKGEKPQVILDWNAILGEKMGIDAQADAMAVSRTGYDSAYTALYTYLTGLVPSYSDTASDTTIVGSTFRSKFTDYYAARQDLLNAIAAKAATLATWGSVSGRPTDDSIRNNLIDVSWWRKGATFPWPLNGEGNAIFPCSPSGTTDLPGAIPGPRGGADLVWYCQEQANNGGSGGGWDSGSGNNLVLDPLKTYRFVVPIRRRSGSATSYWGPTNVCDLNTTSAASNPYFAYAVLPDTEWYLFVGFIFPAGSNGNTHDGAGVWNCKTGVKLAAGSNFCFKSGDGSVCHRAYQYYASNGAEQLFGRPMVNVVDGAEPSLREYFYEAALLNSQQQWADVGGTGKPSDNASSDITLVGRGGITVQGNTITKSSGGNDWNADCYSTSGFTGGAFASIQVASTGCHGMFGLNSDPLADSSYTSLDYAFLLESNGNVSVWENGVQIGGVLATYALYDIYSAIYDGKMVKYMKNGEVLRYVAASPNLKLYFDSSMYLSGMKWSNVRFGPMTSAFTSSGWGSAINDDPTCEDAYAWVLGSNMTIASGTTATGAACDKFFRVGDASSTDTYVKSARRYAIDPSKTYSLTANLYAAAGNNRNMYIWIDFYDTNGTYIASSGWGGSNSGYTYAGTPPTDQWSRQGAQFGVGTTRTIPSNAKVAVIGVRFQSATSGSSSVLQAAQDIRLETSIPTSNLVADCVSGVDVFSSVTSSGSSFVVSVDSKVLVLASIANDSGSGTQGYAIDWFNPGTGAWVLAVGTYYYVNQNSTNLFTLSAGTYRVRAMSGNPGPYVTNVTVLKIKK